MKEKNNIEEGFLFDAEEIGKQETDTQTSEGTESTDAPRRRGRKRSMVTEDRPPLTPEQMRELLEGGGSGDRRTCGAVEGHGGGDVSGPVRPDL